MNVPDVSSIMIKATKLSSSLGLRYAEMLMIIAVYGSWSKYGLGLNCNEILTLFEYQRGNHRHVRARMRRLKGMGLIDVVGTGRGQSKLYAPTDYCIAVVEEHFGSTEGEDKDALM